jgi:hypothetical protein
MAHGARAKPFYYFAGRLYFVDDYPLAGHKFKQSTQSAQLLRLFVDRLGVITVSVFVTILDCVLQSGHRGRIPKVLLASMSEMIFATEIKIKRPAGALLNPARRRRDGLKSRFVTVNSFLRYFFESNPANS